MGSSKKPDGESRMHGAQKDVFVGSAAGEHVPQDAAHSTSPTSFFLFAHCHPQNRTAGET